MTNRREFLQTGVSVTALPLASEFASTSASAYPYLNPIGSFTAIFDDRYTECQTFAKAIGGFGVQVHALNNGDVTDLWARERDALRLRPAPIAGFTQFGPMLVFEQLGKEHRMRMSLRVENQLRDDGSIAHVMTGPPETLALADRMRRQGADWPMLIAALLTHCPTAGSGVEQTIVSPGTTPMPRQTSVSRDAPAPESVIHYYTPQGIREGHGIPWDGPLYFWVIVPGAPEHAGPGISAPVIF